MSVEQGSRENGQRPVEQGSRENGQMPVEQGSRENGQVSVEQGSRENGYSEIDLRSFPSQTEVSFWIIVIVILGTLIGGSIGGSPFLMWPTTLSILILPARALLAWPDKELAKQDHEATETLRESGALERLQSAITALAAKAGYHEPIKLVISQQSHEARAFGSWRRHYIFIGPAIAHQLDTDLQSAEHRVKAEALLVHEIAHFVNRDVQRVGYTRELLRSCFIVLPWWILFLSAWLYAGFLGIDGWLTLDIKQVPGIDPMLAALVAPWLELSPTERAEIVAKRQNISLILIMSYIITAFLIIVLCGFVMRLFYWRRMLRLQEHYADYLVLKVTQNPEALLQAIIRYPISLTIANQDKPLFQRLDDLREDLLFSVRDYLSHYYEHRWYKYIASLYKGLKKWIKIHPTYQERANILEKPALIYQNKLSVTLSLALLILLIDMLLFSPLISYHSGYFLHITTLATFYLLSSWFLPAIVTQRQFGYQLVKMLGLIYGLLNFSFLLNFTLITNLILYSKNNLYYYNYMIVSTWRYSIMPSSLPVSEPIPFLISLIQLYFVFQLLSLIIVLLLLFIYYRLHRKAVQANASHALKMDWHRRHWLSLIALSVVGVTLLSTPMSDLVFGDFDLLLTPSRLFGYGLGLFTTALLVMNSRQS